MKSSFVFKIFVGLFALNLLFGCNSITMGGSSTNISFWLGIGKLPKNYQGIVIVENTPELQRIFKEKAKYITWGIGSDNGEGVNANLFPEKLQIRYATIKIDPNVYYRSLIQDQERIVNSQAQSLPLSAWRTYTIYPQQLLEQGRTMPANGSPAKTWAHGTKVTITLYIDGNGNISQTIEHEPIGKDKWTT